MSSPLAHVFYLSCYGSSKQYAQELARRLGTEAQVVAGPMPEDGLPVIFLSYVHGPKFPAMEYYDTLTEMMEAPLPFRVAVVKVGMTPVSIGQAKCEVHHDFAEFYLRGRLNYSEISKKHHTALYAVATALKLKPWKNSEEKEFLDILGKDTDAVDYQLLDPIIAWVHQSSTS